MGFSDGHLTGRRDAAARGWLHVLGMDEAQARAEIEAIWHPEGVWANFIKG
jgi:hypothetical protein